MNDLENLIQDTNAKLDQIIDDLKVSVENMRKMNDNIEKILLEDIIWEK